MWTRASRNHARKYLQQNIENCGNDKRENAFAVIDGVCDLLGQHGGAAEGVEPGVEVLLIWCRIARDGWGQNLGAFC
jgi:hypothetical protein